MQNTINDEIKKAHNNALILAADYGTFYERDLSSDIYKLENTSNFFLTQDGYIYTIPLGYSSGILLKYKIKPSIDNNSLKVAGRKCMNQTLLFSKNLYFIGQMVEIINEKNTLLSLAKRSNVSIYELISLLNPSIKRTII